MGDFKVKIVKANEMHGHCHSDIANKADGEKRMTRDN